MVVVLTHKEMSCLVVRMFDDLVGPLCINIGDIKITACAVCSNLAISMKRCLPFALSHITYCNRRTLITFRTKTFSLNPVLQIDAIIV